jgi:putative Mn2+ efflux pump MntP
MIGFAFGGVGGSETFAHRTVPLIALCCGIYCMLAAHWNKFRADPRLALALPVLMSFDNLAYGVGIDPTAGNVTGRAAVLGLASFSLALLGLLAGGVIRFPNLRAREWTAGLGMVAACLVLFFW